MQQAATAAKSDTGAAAKPAEAATKPAEKNKKPGYMRRTWNALQAAGKRTVEDIRGIKRKTPLDAAEPEDATQGQAH